MSKKTHNNSIKMANTYAAEHIELKELVNTFVRMSTHPKAMCKIQIGNFNTETRVFTSKLTSNIRFASVLFSSYENEPQVYIRNYTENVCLFNLTGINVYHHEKSSYLSICKEIGEIEIFYFHYNGDDFMLKVTFEYYNKDRNTKDYSNKVIQDDNFDYEIE